MLGPIRVLWAVPRLGTRAAELLALSEGNPLQAKLIEGLIEYRRGRFAEAKTLFEEVVKLNPRIAPAVAALGRLNLLEHNDPEAIRQLERALELNPSDAESAYQLGVLYDRNGRTEDGIRMLRRAKGMRRTSGTPDSSNIFERIAKPKRRPSRFSMIPHSP